MAGSGVTPPLFTQAELRGSTGTGTAALDWATILALFVFVGIVVRCHHASVATLAAAHTSLLPSPQAFCAVQALANPRRTFCAELNGVSEPAAAAVPAQSRPKRSRKAD